MLICLLTIKCINNQTAPHVCIRAWVINSTLIVRNRMKIIAQDKIFAEFWNPG